MDDEFAAIKRFLKLPLALDAFRQSGLMFVQQMVPELPPRFILFLSTRAFRDPALIPGTKACLLPPLGVALSSATTTVDEKLGTPFDHLDRIRLSKIDLGVCAD